jgi:hypothetical protein
MEIYELIVKFGLNRPERDSLRRELWEISTPNQPLKEIIRKGVKLAEDVD